MSRRRRMFWVSVAALAIVAAAAEILAGAASAAPAAQVPTIEGAIPTNLVMWAGIVGFFLPLAIAKINAQSWHADAKSACMFACCLVASAGTAWFAGNLNGASWVTAFLIVFTLTIASYKGLVKPLGIAAALERK